MVGSKLQQANLELAGLVTTQANGIFSGWEGDPVPAHLKQSILN